MVIHLNKIVEKITERAESLSQTDSIKLSEIIDCGNTLIELLDKLIEGFSKDDTTIFKTVIDEIFLDLHVSATLLMGGQYKAACVLLRTCIEISLYILYLIDHPVEARIWADTPLDSRSSDMAFTQILEKITNADYARAASKREPDRTQLSKIKSQLQDAYRLLSERVHGKYAFLQAANKNTDNFVAAFYETASSCIKSLIILGLTLSTQAEQVEKQIPALEKYVER